MPPHAVCLAVWLWICAYAGSRTSYGTQPLVDMNNGAQPFVDIPETSRAHSDMQPVRPVRMHFKMQPAVDLRPQTHGVTHIDEMHPRVLLTCYCRFAPSREHHGTRARHAMRSLSLISLCAHARTTRNCLSIYASTQTFVVYTYIIRARKMGLWVVHLGLLVFSRLCLYFTMVFMWHAVNLSRFSRTNVHACRFWASHAHDNAREAVR